MVSHGTDYILGGVDSSTAHYHLVSELHPRGDLAADYPRIFASVTVPEVVIPGPAALSERGWCAKL